MRSSLGAKKMNMETFNIASSYDKSKDNPTINTTLFENTFVFKSKKKVVLGSLPVETAIKIRKTFCFFVKIFMMPKKKQKSP